MYAKILKTNPNHDPKNGQFTSGKGGGAVAVSDEALSKAKGTRDSYKGKSKKEVFDSWRTNVLGRVNNATIQDQNKSYMIYDLVAHFHTRGVAEALYNVKKSGGVTPHDLRAAGLRQAFEEA